MCASLPSLSHGQGSDSPRLAKMSLISGRSEAIAGPRRCALLGLMPASSRSAAVRAGEGRGLVSPRCPLAGGSEAIAGPRRVALSHKQSSKHTFFPLAKMSPLYLWRAHGCHLRCHLRTSGGDIFRYLQFYLRHRGTRKILVPPWRHGWMYI